MIVGSDDVRDLLESDLDEAHLILEEGVVSVVSGDDVADDPSAMVIATADELRDTHRFAGVPDDDRLETLAAQLDEKVSQLGA